MEEAMSGPWTTMQALRDFETALVSGDTEWQERAVAELACSSDPNARRLADDAEVGLDHDWNLERRARTSCRRVA
jgi:hypothetical protein